MGSETKVLGGRPMQSEVKKLDEFLCEVTVDVPKELVDMEFERTYQELQNKTNIKGYRKGRVPVEKLRQLYQGAAYQKTLTRIIDCTFYRAIEEQALKTLGQPNFKAGGTLEEGKSFNYTLEVELVPEFELKNYKGLKVTRKKNILEEGEVDKIIDTICRGQAQLEPVLEDRGAQVEDVAVVSFSAKNKKGEVISGLKGEDHHVELNVAFFLKGLEKGILGVKAGEEKTVEVIVPESFSDESVAGKPVDLHFKLKELKTRNIPTPNDEWVKTLGAPFETLKDLKENLAKDLAERNKQEGEKAFREDLVKALVEANKFEVPPRFKKSQKDELADRARKDLVKKGASDKLIADYEKKWATEFDELADRMIRSNLLIQKLALELKLHPTPEEIEASLQKISKASGESLEVVKEKYCNPQNQHNYIFGLIWDRVLDLLSKEANVKEI